MHAQKTFRIALVALVVALCVSLLAGCSRFSNNEEDAKAIQGEWQVVGSMMTLVITDNQILFPNGTFYDYKIDTVNGTLEFSVGEVKGEATYHLGTDSMTGVLMLTITETNVDGSQVTQLAWLSDNTNALPTMDGGRITFANLNDTAVVEPAPEGEVVPEGEAAPEGEAVVEEPAPEEYVPEGTEEYIPEEYVEGGEVEGA